MFLSLLVAGAILTLILTGGSSGRVRVLTRHDPAPDFTLPAVDGRTLSLAQFRGRPVVLTFFASWCHPCEEELPVLERLQHELGKRLQVIAVNYQDHVGTDSADFVHRLGVTYPALLQPRDEPVSNAYDVHQIPQTYFIDSDGFIRDRIFGETSRDALQPSIDALLRVS